jgi:hypothetical protein
MVSKSWVINLLINRQNSQSASVAASGTCATPSFVLQPILSVLRITGPASAHPAYGYYVASLNDGVSQSSLVFRYVLHLLTSYQLFLLLFEITCSFLPHQIVDFSQMVDVAQEAPQWKAGVDPQL